MDDRKANPINEQISEEAAAWIIEFRTEEPDSEARSAFDAWLRASPEHLRAFLEIAQVWNEAHGIDAEHRIDVQQLLATHGAGAEIIPLARPSAEGAGHPAVASARSDRKGIMRPRLAAAAVVALVGFGLLLWAPWRTSGIYSTAIGERRSLTLADGTSVTLDARSRLRASFSATNRTVELLEGQALFQIAKDPARPFTVVSGDALVRDIGTQFDVNRNLNGMTVTVLAGRVAVYAVGATSAGSEDSAVPPGHALEQTSAGAAAPARAIVEPIVVAAGEQLRLVSGERAQPVAVDSGSATAWRKGQIVLNASTLADVVEEFNRYSPRQLIAEDNGATPLRLSGVFGIDPQFLIQYLRDRPDITVREGASQVEIIRSAAR